MTVRRLTPPGLAKCGYLAVHYESPRIDPKHGRPYRWTHVLNERDARREVDEAWLWRPGTRVTLGEPR